MKFLKMLLFAVLFIGLLLLIFFQLYGFSKHTVYNEGERVFFIRKLKNNNTFLNILKPQPQAYLNYNDLIVLKNPGIFDEKFGKKTDYYSRLIAKAGDNLLIDNCDVYVNDSLYEQKYDKYFLYRLSMDDEVDFEKLLSNFDVKIHSILYEHNACDFICSEKEVQKIVENVSDILNLRQIIYLKGKYLYGIFPNDPLVNWNPDNFGPIVIPKKGSTVKLTRSNIPIYKNIIEMYENNKLYYDYNKIEINNKSVNRYTFQNDYVFVLNDNRFDYNDSRKWGFVPENQIVGKVIK